MGLGRIGRIVGAVFTLGVVVVDLPVEPFALHGDDAEAAVPPGIVVLGKVAVEGWAEVSKLTAHEMANRFEDAGVAAIIYTDIDRDGLLKGLNLDATIELADAVKIPVIASGGLASIDDVRALLQPRAAKLGGAIAGRALYDRGLDPAAARNLDADGATARLERDDLGRVTAAITPSGHRTTYVWDPTSGLLAERVGPDGAICGAQTHSPGCNVSAARARSTGELAGLPWARLGSAAKSEEKSAEAKRREIEGSICPCPKRC